jgi:hypothetical protein
MPLKHLLLILFFSACSQLKREEVIATPKKFSSAEIIMGSQLLTKIFDQEMAPISCVPDTEEASLLIRTIQPKMELALDEFESNLDDDNKIDELIKNCEQKCLCLFLDDLFREHEIELSKNQIKKFAQKKTQKENQRCLQYMQDTFCQSELYQELNLEKKDFSFEE